MYKVLIFALCALVTISCNPETEMLQVVQTENDNQSKNEVMSRSSTYTMPDETQPHEGTWLQWPHHYQYGTTYRNRLDATWVAMTKALVASEKVHIIAYNATEKSRITSLLNNAGIPMTNIDFKLFQTNDVWVRDNGPIYVKNSAGQLIVQDWGFNGWGFKTPYSKDNVIPASVATAQALPKVDLNKTMVLEGGAFEIDGNGTFLATKSAILNSNRNPGMTQAQAETILNQNLGVTNFIWLTGVPNADLTDMHIDGFARFGDPNTIVTMNNTDLTYWEVPSADITKLNNAKNTNGAAFNFIKLPLTRNNVVTTYGKNLGYKGSYVNYYVGNNRVLVPNYNDPNDAVANQMLQNLYPTKTVVGIDVRNLYANGGMVHCVTQQQPK
jgi:agmatine deiminase